MKKIVMIAVALVVALGGLGIGYAAWTDEVTITGEVSTGTVDLNIEAYSCTYVWKVGEEAEDPDDMVVVYDCTGARPLYAIDAFPNDGQADIDPVAYAIAYTNGEDAVYIDINNAFPWGPNYDGRGLKADFLLHYTGSVPVRVEIAELAVVSGDLYRPDSIIEAWVSNANGDEIALIGGVSELLCYQLHYCDYIKINVIQLAHQAFQEVDSGRSGTIEGRILVKQWNEVVCPPVVD